MKPSGVVILSASPGRGCAGALLTSTALASDEVEVDVQVDRAAKALDRLRQHPFHALVAGAAGAADLAAASALR